MANPLMHRYRIRAAASSRVCMLKDPADLHMHQNSKKPFSEIQRSAPIKTRAFLLEVAAMHLIIAQRQSLNFCVLYILYVLFAFDVLRFFLFIAPFNTLFILLYSHSLCLVDQYQNKKRLRHLLHLATNYWGGQEMAYMHQTSVPIHEFNRSWPSGWCIGLRSWLRGFDAQLGHLHDACTSLPQKS